MFDAKKCPFCIKKLRLRHFCRECRENLSIRVLRTKFWVKSACEDAPQVVPAWYTRDFFMVFKQSSFWVRNIHWQGGRWYGSALRQTLYCCSPCAFSHAPTEHSNICFSYQIWVSSFNYVFQVSIVSPFKCITVKWIFTTITTFHGTHFLTARV